MEKRVITATIDTDLLERLEQYLTLKRTNRSQALRTAILMLLEKEGI